jgi:hypothetical protein
VIEPLDQGDTRLLGGEFGMGQRDRPAAQLGERARHLHPRGASADHHDMGALTLTHRRRLQAVLQPLAQHFRIADRIDRQRVLPGAFDVEPVRGDAAGQHQVVVLQTGAVVELHASLVGSHPAQCGLPGAHVPVPGGEGPRRKRHVAGTDAGRRHLVEQGLKGGVGVSVDQ